jgi:hypothetical protein
MPTKRTLTRQLADARAQVRRLTDERDQARAAAGTGGFNTTYLAKQLDEAREENDRLRRRLDARRLVPAAPEGWRKERSRLRLDLALSERARAALDAQVLQLGAANDRLNREAYDRAQGVTT